MGNTEQDSTDSLQDRDKGSIPVCMVHVCLDRTYTIGNSISHSSSIWAERASNTSEQDDSRYLDAQ